MYNKTLTNVVLVAVVALSLVASAGVVAAGDVTTPAGTPADLETGTETQTISNLTVTNTSAGEDGVDLYLNVTALETADVGLDSLDVQVNDSNVTNANLSDQDVSTEANNTVVRLTFDVAGNETTFTVDGLRLGQLDTGNASATENLSYDVASGDEERVGSDAPGTDDAQTESFAVVDSSDDDETTATETDSGDATETETDDDGTATDSDDGTETDTDSDDGTDTATDDGAQGDDGDTETDAADGDGTDEDGGSFADAPGFGAFAAIAGLLGAALYVRRT